jgi:subtilisin family serine protease
VIARGRVLVAIALLAAACCARRPPEAPGPPACDYVPTEAERQAPEVKAMHIRKTNMWLHLRVSDYLRAVAEGRPIAGTPRPDRTCGPPVVTVDVEFTGDVADLARAGLAKISEGSSRWGLMYVYGEIEMPRIAALAAVEHVRHISKWPPLGSQLNYSGSEARVHALRGELPGMTGAGSIVAIVDNGAVDWRHDGFRNGHTTRLLGIWDQTLQRQGAEVAGPGGIGVVYDRAAIEAALQGGPALRSEDRELTGARAEGHATHTAGIAAGDGALAGCCHGGGTYVGIATAADVLSVRLRDDEEAFEQALAFIRDHEAIAVRHRPVVVNFSVGFNVGAHDGTHRWEQAIDGFTASGPARVVVVSAGNGANRNQHARVALAPAATTDIRVQIRPNDTTARGVEIWCEGPGVLDTVVVSPSGTASAHAAQGAPASVVFVDNGTTVTIFVERIALPPHGDHQVGVLFEAAGGALFPGEWIIRLTNSGALATVHAWAIGEDALSPFFTSQISTETTLKTPATAREAIVVGAHGNKTSWSNCWPDTGIYPASGHGPVRRDAAANRKPDLAAPGADITSANSDPCNRSGRCCWWCPNCCCDVYNDSSGTSAAAPHVSGAIAIMFQADPTLTRAQIAEHLRLSARPAPGNADPNVWGGGKLDVLAAVRRVIAALPPAHAIAAPFPDGDGDGGGVDFARRAPIVDEPALAQPAPSLASVLRERLGDGSSRDTVIALVSRHFSEVRRLINANSRVATMWHRAEGPATLRRLVTGAARGAPAIPGDTQRDYFVRFLGQLERFGSPRLAGGIQRHGADLVALLTTEARG